MYTTEGIVKRAYVYHRRHSNKEHMYTTEGIVTKEHMYTTEGIVKKSICIPHKA